MPRRTSRGEDAPWTGAALSARSFLLPVAIAVAAVAAADDDDDRSTSNTNALANFMMS